MSEQRDAVDRITEQWRSERPDLDPSPMEVVGRITRIAALAERRLETVFDRFELAGGDFDVLATLRRSGPSYRLTPGELSSSTMVTTGGMTKRLDRLEARGLVRREPDPRDRRGKLIVLSDDGRALMDQVVAAHVENERRLLGDLTPVQRARLAALLRELLLSLEGPR